MMRYVILGTGVAGLAAAEVIRELDRQGQVIFICKDPQGYYSRPGLAYYLSGELNEDQLYPYQEEDYKKLDARFYQGAALKINPAEKLVEVENGHTVAYDRLLVATGASATRLTTPGANLGGVFKLDHIEDARQILARARKSKVAVVTGGGITALELAEGLSARGLKVHYVYRSERYWPNVLDESESRLVEKRLEHEGIHLHRGSELTEIIGERGLVKSVLLNNGEQIKCDLVAFAIGIQPSIELAAQAGLSCERGILVDQRMRTSTRDIYAAGDVAQVFDPMIGKHVLDSLWGPAREQGKIAGQNMAGLAVEYQKPAPYNVTRLAGLTATIIGTVGAGKVADLAGIVRGDSETWRNIPGAIVAQGGFENNHLRLMVGDKHIVGAIVMGDQKLSSPLQHIIQKQMDISLIRDQLLKKDAPIADILAEFWATSTTGQIKEG